MKKLSIFWKLLLSIFLVAALSIVSFGVLFYINQKQALIERTTAQLKSVNILKKEMILNRLNDDEKFIWHFIRKVMLFDSSQHHSALVEFHRHKDFLKVFCKDYGHLDVLLLNKNQEVVDNLYEHDINDQGDDSLHFSFIRVFLIDDSQYRIALLTSTHYLEELLFEQTGMGSTGESYIVDSDYRLFTKSRFFPETPPRDIMVRTASVDSAMKNKTGAFQTKDYRGIEVLSAFSPIEHNKVRWVIVSEMDLSEAMQSVLELRTMIVFLGIGVLFIALLVTLYLSKSISSPIVLVSARMEAISKGIIPEKMEMPFDPNEEGQMKLALNRLIDSFDKMTAFATEIGNGNLTAHFEPLGQSDRLGKSLLNMRKQLETYRVKEAALSKQKALFLLEGQEKERKRIARDLHDGLGQWLTGLKLKVASVDMESGQKEKLKGLISETIDEVRRITNNLMPSVLIDFGLDAALRQLVTSIQKTTQLTVHYSYLKNEQSINAQFEVNVTLYRIAQEALNNIAKHAHAQSVVMILTEQEKQIGFSVEDNGKGFSVEESRRKGNGLANMEERVKLLNGSFRIESSKIGTKLNVSIPLK